MKKRPMLFNAPMVRALLDGSKTQSRRVVKFPHKNPLGTWEPTSIGGPNGGRLADGGTVPEQGAIWHTRTGDCLSSPYGQPGDRLWVRETWIDASSALHSCVIYRADGDEQACGEPWKPSIHMPRWASRILLEIVSVRVERLTDISESDAIAEGIEPVYGVWRDYQNQPSVNHHPAWSTAIDSYRSLWESINGTGSWDLNPLVWVIEFKRVTA